MNNKRYLLRVFFNNPNGTRDVWIYHRVKSLGACIDIVEAIRNVPDVYDIYYEIEEE